MFDEKDRKIAELEEQMQELKDKIALSNVTMFAQNEIIEKLQGEIINLRAYCTLNFGESHPEIKICPHEQEVKKLQGEEERYKEALEKMCSNALEIGHCIKADCKTCDTKAALSEEGR